MLNCIILIVILLTFINFHYCSDQEENISIYKTILDSPLEKIVWCGKDLQNILILSEENTVYKSSDGGQTFQSITNLFTKEGTQQTQDLDADIGKPYDLVQSPVDSNLIFFKGTQKINWITTDCGNTLKALFLEQLLDIKFHPTEKKWFLFSFWENLCKTQREVKCQYKKHKQLWLTKDLGLNKNQLASYIWDYSWGFQINGKHDKIPKERIYWTQEYNEGQQQSINNWNNKTNLYMSDNFMEDDKQTLLYNVNGFSVTENYIFVAQIKSTQLKQTQLHVSNINLIQPNFMPANFGQETENHYGFTILDSDDQVVFINVNNVQDKSHVGNIYISDAQGINFAKSIKYNVRDKDTIQCDFQQVEGLQGIYLANIYSGERAINFIQELKYESQGSYTVQLDNKQSQNDREQYIQQISEKLNNYKQTKITFDNGGIWKSLTPPQLDSQNKTICKQNQYNNNQENENCSLHLHSSSSKNHKYGPFYVRENSIGIIIGTGNVGSYLAYHPDEVNTYLSRDAGLTWAEVLKGSYIYEIGDHGAIIVFANNMKATNEIQYTWDEGKIMKKHKINDEEIEIKNIIIEPNNTSQKFFIYGVIQKNDSSQQGIVIMTDFSQIHNHPCKGFDKPGTADSHYEYWTPNGKISPECLLGKKLTYVRRKQTACCYNGEEFEIIAKKEICQCTEEDWECDIGFERKGDGPCKKSDETDIDYSPPDPKECFGYYYVSQGYRKVGGDECENGVDHNYIKIVCPFFGYFNAEKFITYFMIFLCVIIVLYIYSSKFKLSSLFEKILSSPQKQQSENKEVSNTGKNYIDFSKMEFDPNEGQQFDPELIEKQEKDQQL